MSLSRRLVCWLFCGCALLAAGTSRLLAQTDVIRGHVTTVDGLPLPNVRVTATSIPGNVTREVRSDNRGSFQIAFSNGPGDYIMGYSLIGYVFRQFEVKRTVDQDVLLADARLSVVQLDTVAVVSSVQQKVSRNSSTPDVGGTERSISAANLPIEVMGDLAAMAASLPGVTLVPGLDGAADGFSVLGLGADQNSVTLNGVAVGANGLPRDASLSTSLTTSPYDVSRGGFSGANLNIRPGSGTNYRNRGMSLVLNAPQLEWTDRAAQALGAEYTNVSIGGLASGPISYNKSFYNFSYQLGRQSRDNQTLLGTNDLGLQTAGIAPDSVVRFVDILRQRAVGTFGGPLHSSRLSDNGTFLTTVTFSPPNSTNGNSFDFTVNGNWSRQSPVGGGVSQLASASGDRMNWGGGIQGHHSGYVHMLLSETTLGINLNADHGDPYVLLPAGRVLVNSTLVDGVSGVQNLTFGGNQGLSSTSRSLGSTFSNTLSWFDDANKHRIKLTTEASYNANAQNQASNLLGTFTFNSLEDLDAGQAATFTRTLSTQRRSTSQVSGALSIGDSYRRTEDLQIQYGVRADAARFLATPAYNPAVMTAFGRRNDLVPNPLSLSPRIGFSWTLGDANEIASFFGQARAPRAVVQGGVGVLTNASNVGAVASAVANTGLPSGIQQVVCVGPAVPLVDWTAFVDPAAIPDRCADGSLGSVFSNGAPNVSLVSPNFRPQRTIRSNLSWTGPLFDARFRTTIGGTYSLNLNQQRSVDLNFQPIERFALGADGRPVYVAPTSIVQETGSIASRDARVSQDFNRVTELRSDLQSRSAQLQVSVAPIYRTPTRFGWSLAYTYINVREQVSGFSSTAGNPLDVIWATSAQGPHSVNYSLRYNFFNTVSVNWTGVVRSGSAFTPMIAGDVNGDGYSNDRAFIYSPKSAPDSAIAAGMTQLLNSSSSGARDCLSHQLDKIAERNSCRGPWSSTASMSFTLDRARFRMPQRTSISFSVSNPLGAADLLVNGSGHLRGWGQTPTPDQSLFYVRGFDQTSQRYIYEVNQRFGATRPQFITLRAPVTLTASMKYDLGAPREQQSLLDQINAGRKTAGTRYSDATFRSIVTNSISNPMSTILRQQDSLHLTALQADSIAAMNRRYTYRVDSLWAPIARYLAALPVDYHASEATERYVRGRRAHIELLMRTIGPVRDLLTAEQRRKLPQSVVNSLDPRYLDSIRNGTGIYVGANSSTSFDFR
ncbi:MAG TPA: TonB-dependent receptor [Gemmatimonadaceae bacterium]|jgi:hypothetical protein